MAGIGVPSQTVWLVFEEHDFGSPPELMAVCATEALAHAQRESLEQTTSHLRHFIEEVAVLT